MFNVVLVEPEIPQNTGNIIRLCANAGAQLHLIEPLGFPLDSAKMKRAGLDYHEFTHLKVHSNWAAFLTQEKPAADRLFALTTRGTHAPSDIAFQAHDWLVFGSEGKGLAQSVRDSFGQGQALRLPMRPDNRSLNLSNAVAIVVYEAWRQLGFSGSV
jgi:tRNA (cytidine/uridine-2'-O-)-methyltransferase